MPRRHIQHVHTDRHSFEYTSPIMGSSIAAQTKYPCGAQTEGVNPFPGPCNNPGLPPTKQRQRPFCPSSARGKDHSAHPVQKAKTILPIQCKTQRPFCPSSSSGKDHSAHPVQKAKTILPIQCKEQRPFCPSSARGKTILPPMIRQTIPVHKIHNSRWRAVQIYFRTFLK